MFYDHVIYDEIKPKSLRMGGDGNCGPHLKTVEHSVLNAINVTEKSRFCLPSKRLYCSLLEKQEKNYITQHMTGTYVC